MVERSGNVAAFDSVNGSISTLRVMYLRQVEKPLTCFFLLSCLDCAGCKEAKEEGKLVLLSVGYSTSPTVQRHEEDGHFFTWTVASDSLYSGEKPLAVVSVRLPMLHCFREWACTFSE